MGARLSSKLGIKPRCQPSGGPKHRRPQPAQVGHQNLACPMRQWQAGQNTLRHPHRANQDVRERARRQQAAKLHDGDAATGTRACEGVGGMGMSINGLTSKLAKTLGIVLLALFSAQIYAQALQPLSKQDIACLSTRPAQNKTVYCDTENCEGHSSVFLGDSSALPFYLKNAPNWQQWTPNIQVPSPKLALQLDVLPAELIQSYMDGTAGVHPRLIMWRANAAPNQLFAMTEEHFNNKNCRLVAYQARDIIAIGGTVMYMFNVSSGSMYPARLTRKSERTGKDYVSIELVNPKKGEVVFHIGEQDTSTLAYRYLVLKFIKAVPCKDGDFRLQPKFPEARCDVYLASARLIEYSREPAPSLKYQLKETEVGEVYMRVDSFYHWDKIYTAKSPWWEKLIAPLINIH